MTADEPLLDEIANAILDDAPLDWPLIESRATRTNPTLIGQLKVLAALRAAGQTWESQGRAENEYWGHLRVLDCVGRGAFGEVYRAWDTRLDREVALKLLPPDSFAADSSGSSIIEEGRLLARVRHPNVVTIYGAERIDGRVGLWMEFLKGRTLEDTLRAGKRFTPKEVARIGVELCRAVSAVHAAGLLHRDIKAQNVMVADDGRTVLMDFGAGRELEASSENIVAGTPLYLSPEVLSGAAASPRSEVYSIGVLLHHLLTGSYPVQAHDLADLRRAHAAGARVDLRKTRPDVPQRLARVIETAVEPEPDRRYDSVGSLGAALAALENSSTLLRAAYAAAAALAVGAVAWAVWEFGARDPVNAKSTASAAAAALHADRPVIAVLPFRNLSSEPDSDYFVDGLTSEVIRNLAVIDGLQVRSQTSSFSFKNQSRNLPQVADQLRANLIVEADVLRVGRRLRINAQLVQVAGDVPLWSERFDRTLEDVFAIQDEISRAIVNKLRLTLGRGQRRYQTNAEAYELYLRARAVLDRKGNENARRAAALFDQVIAKDPAFAPAYAGVAGAYAGMSWGIGSEDDVPPLSFDEALRRMRPAAVKAMELDPLLAEAHAAIGLMYSRENNWKGAQESFQRAIDLNPSLTPIHTNYSLSTLLPLGKSAEAERLLDAALQSDPLSLDVQRSLALVQIVAGRYDDALANVRRVLAVDPAYPYAPLLLARALTFSGRLEEADGIWKTRNTPGWNHWAAHAYVRSGRRAEAERIAVSDEHPYRQALVYAALGDKDRTLEALSRAIDVLPQRTAVLLTYPEMALLRGDPRLDALRRKLNIP